MSTTDTDEGLQTSGAPPEPSQADIIPEPLCKVENSLVSTKPTTETQNATKESTISKEPNIPPNEPEAKCDDETKKVEPLVAQETPPTPTPPPSTPPPPPAAPPKLSTENKETEKKKEDEKLIYKALAIKLKKELVKSRDELQRLREDSSKERETLNKKIKDLEASLETSQQTSATTITTLEARVKSLKGQLDNSELDLQNLQNDFENYKIQASKIMQQNNTSLLSNNKTFEEDRYKQLRELNDEHTKRISTLESQLSDSISRNNELESERKLFQEELEALDEKLKSMKTLDDKCEKLSHENENLKLALRQFRTKLNSSQTCDDYSNRDNTTPNEGVNRSRRSPDDNSTQTAASNTTNLLAEQSSNVDTSDQQDDTVMRISPSASLKDDSQTNSSSSYDGSTSGYVHIKPTTFEIISRASVLEDAQNQIDNLTKAYLDSENTNSLLSDQVRALKEEIRRMQRGNERLDLAENLEYLKNVVFKFISLDSGQIEQRLRLVPVLSTVLKLSPEETAKLSSLAIADKPSMASSFFKL